ncbi:MAG: hypothetical protein JSS49_22220 [Planctomycetes bacterium]|nr:hypothetical protein [Planctomycetota bacterium]
MTEEELQALIVTGDAQPLLDAMAGMPESERLKLARFAASLIKPEGAGQPWKNHRTYCCAHLAVFGLGSWDQVRKLSRELNHLATNNIRFYSWLPEVLKNRRPEWLERWASHQLADPINPQWGVVRKLVREGICPKPNDDNYIIKMIHGFWEQRLADENWQLADSLRADPGLMNDEIWKIFEVEPPGKGVLLFTNDLVDHPMSWSKALKVLSAAGEIDRGQLLTKSLEALRTGRRAAGATWYFRFHELLEPTLEERVERQSLYLDLLSNTVPAVIAFALESLSLLAKQKRLDANAYLDAVPRVFDVEPKGPPVTAIKLLSQLVKQQPGLAPSGALAVCHAVGHESPDVQLAGITFLESLKLEPNSGVAAELDTHIPSVAASLRGRVKQLRQNLQSAATSGGRDPAASAVETERPRRNASSKRAAKKPTTAGPSSATAEINAEEIALRSEIAALTKAQKVSLGIDSTLRLLDGGGDLVAVTVDPLKRIQLLPEHELKPIASLDELLDAMLSAIETPCDADQFERILDGLSRLCDQRPPDFATRTAPLLKRAAKLSDGFKPLLQHELGLRGLSFFLVAAWCQPGATVRIETADAAGQTGLEFLVDRVRELVCRVTAGRAAPLIAAPTHRGGWLSPVVLVNRLLECQRTGLEPDALDLIQALLRLAPDGRKAASALARKLKSPVADAVRFAVGGPFDDAGAAAEPALWIAALRGRDPSLSIPKHKRGFDGPDVWGPATRQWNAVRRPDSRPEDAEWPLTIHVAIKPGFGAKKFRSDLPTLKLNYERRLDDEWVDGELRRYRQRWPKASLTGIERQLRWSDMAWGPGTAAAVLQIWPINPDPTFVTGIESILCVLDAPASTLRRTAEFLQPLFVPQTPFSEMAQLLVAVSLVARDAGLNVYATDALIALIDDGRCVGDELGGVYRKLIVSDALKCNRLAAQLGVVARVSPLHAHVCSRIVQSMFNDAALLPNSLPPNDAHHLLALLLEWLVELEEPLHAATRRVLSTVTGSSKTAKLARDLVARTSPANAAHRRQVILESLRGRLRSAKVCPP